MEIDAAEDNISAVEDIIGRKKRKGKFVYLVQWRDKKPKSWKTREWLMREHSNMVEEMDEASVCYDK